MKLLFIVLIGWLRLSLLGTHTHTYARITNTNSPRCSSWFGFIVFFLLPIGITNTNSPRCPSWFGISSSSTDWNNEYQFRTGAEIAHTPPSSAPITLENCGHSNKLPTKNGDVGVWVRVSYLENWLPLWWKITRLYQRLPPCLLSRSQFLSAFSFLLYISSTLICANFLLLGSTDHRGTPEFPGRTVTLEPAEGEVCVCSLKSPLWSFCLNPLLLRDWDSWSQIKRRWEFPNNLHLLYFSGIFLILMVWLSTRLRTI